MKIIKIMLISIFTISLVTGCGCEKKEEKPNEDVKVNTNEGVIKDQTVEVFEMKNTSLVYENGRTLLETTVTNTSSEEQYLKEFEIKVMNKEEVMVTLKGFVGSSIKAGETKVINSYCGEDLSSATSITYTVVK